MRRVCLCGWAGALWTGDNRAGGPAAAAGPTAAVMAVASASSIGISPSSTDSATDASRGAAASEATEGDRGTGGVTGLYNSSRTFMKSLTGHQHEKDEYMLQEMDTAWQAILPLQDRQRVA